MTRTGLRASLFAGVAALAAVSPAAPQTTPGSPPSFPGFAATDTPASVARLSIAASVLRSVVNPMAAERDRWDVLRPANAPGAFRTLDTIFQEYEYRVSRDRLDAFQYGVAGWTIKGSVIVGGAFAPAGTLPAIARGLGTAGANAGTDSAVDELTKHGEGQTSSWLEDALTGFVQGDRLPSDLSTLRPLSPQRRLQWVINERVVDDLITRAGGVRDEDRPIVEGMVLRALNRRLSDEQAIQRDRDRLQDVAVSGLARQIGAVAGTLNEFRAETQAGLQEIAQEQAELNQRLDTLEGYAKGNREDLEFVQRFMFDRMEPAEQLAALSKGIFPNMPQAERARVTARIEAIEQRQRVIRAVSDFGQGAAAVARIADKLGVDRNVVDLLGKTAEASRVAQAVATGLMSGGLGYLAAADAVVGLVFGGGPDPGVQRHEQVIRALEQISEQITVVQDMLRAVSQQVEEVRRLQLATLESIGKLSQQVQANHQEVMAGIAQIRIDLVPISSIVNEILFSEIQRCSLFRLRLRGVGFTRERAVSPRLTYAELRSIDQQEEHGVICRRGLRTRLGDPFGPNVTYALNRFTGVPGSEVERFLRDLYDPTWALLSDRVLRPDRVALYARSFTTPVSDLRAVEAKRTVVLGPQPPAGSQAFAGLGGQEISRRLSTALSAQAIQLHACFLAFAHPFFEMAEALQDQTPTRLAALETTSIEGRELLRTTLGLVETAIAQQVMLGGDIMLTDLERLWREGSVPRAPGEADADFARRAAPWAQLQAVLRVNGALRHNLILQAVSRATREAGNMVLYGAAYGLPGDDALLKTMLPEPQFALAWQAPPAGQAPRPDRRDLTKSTGWHLRLGDEMHPLPTPLELVSGELVQTPELRGLLDLRNELAAELESYLTPQRLTASQRSVLRQAVLRVSVQMTRDATEAEARRQCE